RKHTDRKFPWSTRSAPTRRAAIPAYRSIQPWKDRPGPAGFRLNSPRSGPLQWKAGANQSRHLGEQAKWIEARSGCTPAKCHLGRRREKTNVAVERIPAKPFRLEGQRRRYDLIPPRPIACWRVRHRWLG